MRCLIIPLTIVLCLLASKAPAGKKFPVDLELVLAVDVSGSVDEDEAALQRIGYVNAIRDPEVINAITSGFLRRIGITYFEWAGGSWQKPVMGWTLIDGEKAAEKFASDLAKKPLGFGPWTSISSAISYGMALLEQSPFEGTRQIIDVSGDGPNNTGLKVNLLRDQAVAKRITINGLPIINDRPNFGRKPMPNLDLYYRNCVIGGPRAFIVAANGFQDFSRAIRRKLILEIANHTPSRENRIFSAEVAQTNLAPGSNRWIPPCDEGEKNFGGSIDDE